MKKNSCSETCTVVTFGFPLFRNTLETEFHFSTYLNYCWILRRGWSGLLPESNDIENLLGWFWQRYPRFLFLTFFADRNIQFPFGNKNLAKKIQIRWNLFSSSGSPRRPPESSSGHGPADARDDGPQRVDRLHHRQRRIENRRNQVWALLLENWLRVR